MVYLDPLRTIASGALLIVTSKKNAGKIISLLRDNGIITSLIGEIKEKGFGVKIETGGTLEDLKFSAKDEITKIIK